MGRFDAFGHHVHAGEYLRKPASLAQFNAHLPIAAQLPGAGQHQITQSCKASQCLRPAAGSDGQAADLGRAAGNQRSRGVGAVTQPGQDTRGNCDHVLHRTAELRSDHVGIEIKADVASGEGLLKRPAGKVEDTIERPTLARRAPEPEEDLLSSTSILRADAAELGEATGEMEAGFIDLSDATGELPTIEAPTIDATGVLKRVDFPLDGEAATMSEVGTKLDLARAYIDMGDPEGARSILDEVLKEGNPNQRKEAERLLAGLP